MAKHVMCSCGRKFHDANEWHEHYLIGQPLAKVAMEKYHAAHHIVKRRIKNTAEPVVHKTVRSTDCKTRRQVDVFLAKYDIVMKHGILWRMSDGARVEGYVEKLQRGNYTVCIHI